MDAKRLKTLFNPRSIAVIGASDRSGSVGYSLFKNLTVNGFPGPVFPVNSRRDSVQGIEAYPAVGAIPGPIDLAVIATRAASVPEILDECAAHQILSAVVVSAGFAESGPEGAVLAEKIRQIAQSNKMALLGPNCLGFMRPELNLNASFSRKMPIKGEIAFVSQSGALCTAVLDWSLKEQVGFSFFVSIGDMVDIGFHDLIDYLGSDPGTRAILIYMETLDQARRFMSAARSFARTKPIIVLKVGKSQEGARAALYHTGSITSSDQIFDAAFKRAGILRVDTIAELFDCAKTLSMQRLPRGSRLAIVTNAGGPGVIATDALIDQGGSLADLTPETMQQLSDRLPPAWSRSNPIDVLGDADPQRYRIAVGACLKDKNVDGVLAVLTPQAMTDAAAVAADLVDEAKLTYKTVLAAFMGEDDVADGRRILDHGKIPAYKSPEEAVRSFLNMCAYRRNLKMLNETPHTVPHAFTPMVEEARKLFRQAASSGSTVLTYPETKEILKYYDIPTPHGAVAESADQANAIAASIGFPVMMKVVSRDIIYESDIEAAVFDIQSAAQVEQAFTQILEAVCSKKPDARVAGVYVEKTVRKRYELLIGSKKDPIFGPVIVFGMGGVAVDIFKDTSIGLPPLNMALAQQLIDGTKISQLLRGYRGTAGVDIGSIQFLLYKFAYLIMDFPEIKEMDINPYAIDEEGGAVLDAKIILDEGILQETAKPYAHLVICPYPSEYERVVRLNNGESVLLRPIRPEDEPMEAELFRTFSAETARFRFFGPIKDASHELLIRYTQVDYDREIAMIAEMIEDGVKKMIGVVRLIADPYNDTAEYAIVVGDPWANRGLGTIMTQTILEIAKERGIQRVFAYTLEDNSAMLHIFQKFGFKRRREDDLIKVELPIESVPSA